jgi:hypothetical protein
MQYLLYYNHQRPHQGINRKTPVEMIALKSEPVAFIHKRRKEITPKD